MSKPVIKSINLKVSGEQKDKLDDLAVQQGATLKDVILNGTIYSKESELSEQLSSLTKELHNLKAIEQQQEALESEIERLSDLLEAKDVTISNLGEQLEQANKRIDDYTRLLENQQSLNLATAQSNKDLQLKLETIEEKERKGFFARIFSRD